MKTSFDPRVTPWEVDERLFESASTRTGQLETLVRYAILAPSSHNTQPWRFGIKEDHIDIFADRSRWLRVADPDRRELYLSIGCALENLLVAAEHFGMRHETSYLPESSDADLAATVFLDEEGEPSPFRPPVLFDMIPVRHTNHGPYLHRRVAPDILRQLHACNVEEQILLRLLDEERPRQQIEEMVVRGDAILFANPAFRNELGYWIGQGVFGTPWLISKIGQFALKHLNVGATQAKRDRAGVMSSPVIGVISTTEDDRRSQLLAGQVYERLSLRAAAFGIWTQPLSQIIEVPELKQELAKLIGAPESSPLLAFRLGYGAAETHHKPRRPWHEVMV